MGEETPPPKKKKESSFGNFHRFPCLITAMMGRRNYIQFLSSITGLRLRIYNRDNTKHRVGLKIVPFISSSYVRELLLCYIAHILHIFRYVRLPVGVFECLIVNRFFSLSE